MKKQIETVRLRPENIKLGDPEKLESWCTWHLNETDTAEYTELNKHQAGILMQNYETKLDELLNKAVFVHLKGRTPSDTEILMEIEKVRFDDEPERAYWFWGCEPILLTTEPKSRITEFKTGAGGRYYLTWHHKQLTGMEKN